ncbi:reverse transcriptase domain-containing protein [Tanacetum coccineum]
MFTRSVVIHRRVEDLQLGVESYQKKLNLTKPDTYRSNLRRQDAYTPYSDPRGFIYENKDKKNRLMRIDELHKFSDGTLDDVLFCSNIRLKGIRMEYLPQTFWSQRDKANARAMIQAIDKRLKIRMIMRSLERIVVDTIRVEESKAEDEANVEDTAYPGKEDGLDSLSFMAWAKAALMTFSEDMLIRRSQSQSLCSPLSVMWVRNPNQKSSASQWLNGSHHPPLAQTPFAALITRSRGTLLGGLHDDSQSEVFYYAIFISSKTGLGGWSQWSMKIPRRVVLSLASGITLNGIDRSSLPSSTSSGVKPAKNEQVKAVEVIAIVSREAEAKDGEARDWLDKEPPRSILTWDDLVSKFINQYFPPSKTTYYRNEIITFYQKPNEAFNEAWERFKGLLRQCPHHGFSELHQLDTFYNSLNSNDQDALDSAAGGNFLDKMPQEGLAIIESKSKVRYSRSRANDSRVSTDAPLSNSSSSNTIRMHK